jgi:hypothetical protein
MNNSGRTSNADTAMALRAVARGPMWKTNYPGRAAKKILWAWGSAQVIEKAQFGEGNPRIS